MRYLKIFILLLFFAFKTYSAIIKVSVDNILYEIDSSSGIAVCSGFEDKSVETQDIKILESITYSGRNYTVQSIKDRAFKDCLNIYGHLTIPNSIEKIGEQSFQGCTNLVSLSLGLGVVEIGNSAFDKCINLSGSLNLKNNITIIGNNAFSYTGFEGDLYIGDSVTSIGERAFEFTNFKGTLHLGSSLRSIGEMAFYQCSNFMGELNLPETLISIGEYAFYKCTGFTGDLIIPNKVSQIGAQAFGYCSGFNGSLYIGNSLQTLEDSIFSNCTGFKGNLYFGDSIKKIGRRAFEHCGFNGNIILPESLEEIGNYAFMSCYYFSGDLIIPTNVVSIGKYAFHGCLALDGQLIIGNNVKSIGEYAFERDSKLSSVKCEAIVPPKCEDFALYNLYNSILFVPELSLEEYKISNEWEKFKNINSSQDNIPALSITLNVQDITFYIGQTYTLTATVLPENTTDKTVTWTSDKPETATVDTDGMVTAVSVGVTTITATCGDVSTTCKVTVNPVPATCVEINVTDLTLHVGQTDKLTATVTPNNTTDKTVTWESDNEAVATVGTDGTVTGISVGIANITATSGEVSATCKVTVNPVIASSITLNVQDITLLVGQTDKVTATVSPDNTTDKTVTWKSDNEAIAIVGSDGIVTGVSVGIANITATCGEASATCKVTVNPVEVSSIELSLQDVTLLIGSSTTLTAKVYPENATDQKITWSSSVPSIVRVDDSGTITALQIGETIITATCGNASATCKVTVTPVSPSSIELNIKDMILYVGQSETIQAIVRPANTTYPTVTWQSGDEKVATVTADGKVTGISEGFVTITASCGELSAECIVTVNPIPASNIEITTGDVTLTIGNSTTLLAKVLPENTTHPEVEWVSSNPDIATITPHGTVTGISIGSAIITAKCDNVSATCTVTVIPVPSEGIIISPTSVSMLLGDELTLTASVFPENTTDKNITWGSDNPSVASVSSNGVVTALNLGTATITASNGSSKASCIVTVNPIVATSISLNIKDETIFVASTTQLVATISPANVTDKTITWTSSKPEIATVTDDGLVYGVSVGTTTVTATIGSVSVTCQINVVHRIPDMDPSVTTSNRDIKTMSGNQVNMAVYPMGGEPTGWSCSWTKNGEIVSQSTELNITAINDSETVIAEIYRVKVENEIDNVMIFSEVYDFVVQIYPVIDVSQDDIDIIVSTGNGSSNKTREGNIVNLTVKTPNGGNPQGWEYVWSDAKGEIGNEEYIETIATMSSGSSMAIEETTYKLNMTNYSPDGDIWAQFNVESNLEVYRRPQTPLQLLRKGDGTSHTFVVMMPLSDLQLEQLHYQYVYGWTDAEGNNYLLEQSELRYCHTTPEIYNDPTNKFWVYSIWQYQDNSLISSGLCYLDGSINESFDASVFDGSHVNNETGTKSQKAVYRIDGQYMGDSLNKLRPGIYIVITESNGVKNSQKIVIR